MAAAQLTCASPAGSTCVVAIGSAKSHRRPFSNVLLPRVGDEAPLHLPPRSHYVRNTPADSQAWKQPKKWETRTWKDFVKSFFIEETILLYFRNREGQITPNVLRQPALQSCSDYPSLVEDLRAYLEIPDNEELKIVWGTTPSE